jgi:hypothetical protein
MTSEPENDEPKEPGDALKNRPLTDDSLYKDLFGHALMVESLFCDFVRQPWVGHADFKTLRKENSSFVSDDYRQRHSDLVWRVMYKGRPCYIYLLFEFQSNVEHFMSVRIMSYVGLLYQDIIKSKNLKAGDKLPNVFPLVLHTGKTPWTAPLEVGELLDPEPAPDFWPSGRIRHPYFLIDARRLPAEALAYENSLAATQMFIERAEDLIKASERMRNVLQLYAKKHDRMARALMGLLVARMKRYDKTYTHVEREDIFEEYAMIDETLTTWADNLKESGIRIGLQEGQVKLLSTQLTEAFGHDVFSKEAEGRLKDATIEQLEAWGKRVLTAKTIGDVFDD